MSLRSLIASESRGEILLPVLRRYLVKEAEDLQSGRITKEQLVIQDAEMTIRAFQERKRVYEGERHPEGEYFHPSSLGQCIRKLFFQHFDAPQDFKGIPSADQMLRDYGIFETGTYLHVLLQNLCEKAGVLVRREIPIISKKYQIIGHADGEVRLEDENCLLEIKTQNSRWFSQTKTPDFGYVKQMRAYMKCLGLKKGVLLYFDKDRAQFKEFVIDFNEQDYQTDVRARIQWHFANVRTKTLPVREGVNPKLMPCSFCQFTHVCWGDSELERFMKTLSQPTRPPLKLRLV